MDIESTMKVNELARDPVKKGIAPNSEEASKMAQGFLQKKIVSPESMAKPEGIDKYEILMERMQRKFNSEISSLKEKMNSIIGKLKSVTDDIERLINNCI